MIDFSNTVIIASNKDKKNLALKAATMLREELYRRTQMDCELQNTPSANRPAIIIGETGLPPHACIPPSDIPLPETGGEGCVIHLQNDPGKSPRIWIIGGCGRALLYGAGRLLRLFMIHSEQGSLALPDQASGVIHATVPRFPLRGHQLGYRSLPNTYDAWDVRKYEQYLRDMLIFGANCVELTPTLNPDEPPTEIMPVAPWEMTRRISALLDSYDTDLWLWLPNEDWDRSDPLNWNRMLQDRERLYAETPRIDHLFVPGGDPGDIPADLLMGFLERNAKLLHQYHPKAGIWLSPQGFTRKELSWFYRYLQDNEPEWLTGVVYGPWICDTLRHCRQLVPSRYRFRRYPDITHCTRCQYPVPGWDAAYALTLCREPINPRPLAQAYIHNLYMNEAEGALCYSEGVNDDVNKFVWLERLWDPEKPVRDILLEYGRVFGGARIAEDIADGILDLEENWKGPLLRNSKPEQTLARWSGIWRSVREEDCKSNWRLQQLYFRSLCDAYVRIRLAEEKRREEEALDILKSAGSMDAESSIRKALSVLSRSAHTPETAQMRREIYDLGDSLWRTIGMQMSVSLYHADGEERGAVLDTIDRPLSNRAWLENRFHTALGLSSEAERRDYLDKTVRWEDPGDGGFYDDLGNPENQAHLVKTYRWEDDPGRLLSAFEEFGGYHPEYRQSWNYQATTLYDTPLEMHYEMLDSGREYRLRVVYHGRFHSMMRLFANDAIIHEPISGTIPPTVMEFDIPRELTQKGYLRLRWESASGRGCQIAEVWLVTR
jgi:hypothetical protein